MITPPFQVTQDDQFIYIYMKIKYIKVCQCLFKLTMTRSSIFMSDKAIPSCVVAGRPQNATFSSEIRYSSSTANLTSFGTRPQPHMIPNSVSARASGLTSFLPLLD